MINLISKKITNLRPASFFLLAPDLEVVPGNDSEPFYIKAYGCDHINVPNKTLVEIAGATASMSKMLN